MAANFTRNMKSGTRTAITMHCNVENNKNI